MQNYVPAVWHYQAGSIKYSCKLIMNIGLLINTNHVICSASAECGFCSLGVKRCRKALRCFNVSRNINTACTKRILFVGVPDESSGGEEGWGCLI